MHVELSPAEARNLVLSCQQIHRQSNKRGKAAALAAIEHLGYVQIDTISVVQRAHHHVLWSRCQDYQPDHLDQLQRDAEIFEYWSHAAAYLPIRDYRFSLPKKNALRGGEKHWFDVDKRVLRTVLKRVRDEGPLQSRDFEDSDKIKTGWGDFKVAKRALEQLFMRGDLMIARRESFQKVYDLPERVLPSDLDTSTPTNEEYLDYLILSSLSAAGLASAAQCGYLRKGIKQPLRKRCQELVEDGRLIRVTVQGEEYFGLSNYESHLQRRASKRQVKILSPFDNLVIQRDRLKALFDFDYQIECYVPEKKRVFGYFVLPVLWGNEFAGRLDAKIDRSTKLLTVHRLFIETQNSDEFLQHLYPELEAFCLFNGGEEYEINEIFEFH